MSKKREWLLLLIVVLLLSWMALGHQGPVGINKFVLTPFVSHANNVICLANFQTCSKVVSSAKNLFFDLLGNIVVFVPLGYVLGMVFGTSSKGLIKALLFGFLLSLSFEIIQIWIPGRVVAVDDVILNTIGTVVGWCIYVWLSNTFREQK